MDGFVDTCITAFTIQALLGLALFAVVGTALAVGHAVAEARDARKRGDGQ